jgi:DNA-binding FrmR family transcriptional regulator
VLTQVLAAHAALEKVAGAMVNASLEECLLLPPEEARAIISANVKLLAHI